MPPLLDNGGLIFARHRLAHRRSKPATCKTWQKNLKDFPATVSGSLRRLLFASLKYVSKAGDKKRTETFVPVLILAYLFLLRLKNNAVSIPAREMTITILHSKIFVLSPVLTAVSDFVEVVGCFFLEIIEMTAVSLQSQRSQTRSFLPVSVVVATKETK